MNAQILLCVVLSSGLATATVAKTFSDSATEAALRYWRAPERYQVAIAPDAPKNGRWQVRQTPEGSAWLHKLSRLSSAEKRPPTEAATAVAPEEQSWQAWIDARIAYDRYIASLDAQAANQSEYKKNFPALPLAPGSGPMPESLARVMPEPPAFAEAAEPKQHIVVFDDGKVFKYVDNVVMHPKTLYYRFRDGVRDSGTPMKQVPQEEIDRLLNDAKISSFERKVMQGVSMLEGGFDSVNTYDTGLVSVGFIQFACLTGGAGSLGQVLLRQKLDSPDSFQRDFTRFGLDVQKDGQLVALNLETGEEKVGPEAAAQIIKDKRLIAVFHRAGKLSYQNRLAQLKIAKALYYPGPDTLPLIISGRLVVVRIDQFIKSEAGMATLMDRKVNTGKVGPIGDYAQEVVNKYNLNSVEQIAAYEREIIVRSKFRKDYLAEPSLTQPPALPDPNMVDP